MFEAETKKMRGGKEREREMQLLESLFFFWMVTTHDKQERRVWPKSIAVPFDHFPRSWVLLWLRDVLTPDICAPGHLLLLLSGTTVDGAAGL